MKKSVVAILSLLVTIGSSMAFANEPENTTKCPFAIAAGLHDYTKNTNSPALTFGATGQGIQSGKGNNP